MVSNAFLISPYSCDLLSPNYSLVDYAAAFRILLRSRNQVVGNCIACFSYAIVNVIKKLLPALANLLRLAEWKIEFRRPIFNVDGIDCTSTVLCCHSLPPLRLIPSNYVAQGKFTSLHNIGVAVHSYARVCDKREHHFYWKSRFSFDKLLLAYIAPKWSKRSIY